MKLTGLVDAVVKILVVDDDGAVTVIRGMRVVPVLVVERFLVLVEPNVAE